MKARTLGFLLKKYFTAHLERTKGLSINTIRSYRDTWMLFLKHLSGALRKRVEELELAEITKDRVLLFLDHLEDGRRNSIRTRNQRLCAIKSFFRFLSEEDPEQIHQADRVIRISLKKHPQNVTRFIELELLEKLFDSLPRYPTGEPHRRGAPEHGKLRRGRVSGRVDG